MNDAANQVAADLFAAEARRAAELVRVAGRLHRCIAIAYRYMQDRPATSTSASASHVSHICIFTWCRAYTQGRMRCMRRRQFQVETTRPVLSSDQEVGFVAPIQHAELISLSATNLSRCRSEHVMNMCSLRLRVESVFTDPGPEHVSSNSHNESDRTCVHWRERAPGPCRSEVCVYGFISIYKWLHLG